MGVIGTGKIGQAVSRDLSGFGCKIYAYDVYRSESVKEYADYVENVQEIYQKCDLITLHMPLFESNFHMIDEKAMAQMKDGVVLIKTAVPRTAVSSLYFPLIPELINLVILS